MTEILNPDWNAFVEVGLAGSLSKAAIRLRVRQPGLSRRLQRLESAVGMKLFERSNRGVRLTSAGQGIFTALLAQRDQLSNVVALQIEKSQEVSGPLRLGCHRSVAILFLPSLISTLLKAHPKLQPEFQFTDSREVLRLIQQGLLDFGLVVDPKPSPDLVIRNVFKESVGLFEANRSRDVSIQLLIYNPEMVLLPRFRTLVRRHRVITVADYDVAAAMASQISGSTALVPASVAARWQLRERGPQIKANIYLVYRSSMRGTKVVAGLLSALAGFSAGV